MGVIAVTFRKILVLLRVIDRLKEDVGPITYKLILLGYKRKLALQKCFKLYLSHIRLYKSLNCIDNVLIKM